MIAAMSRERPTVPRRPRPQGVPQSRQPALQEDEDFFDGDLIDLTEVKQKFTQLGNGSFS